MGNQRLIFSIYAITLGLMLLGSVFTGSAPVAFADDDLDDKIKEIRGQIESHNDKCPKKKKYEGQCDLKRPKIDIEFPRKYQRVSSPVTAEGTASDSLSGIDRVRVSVDFKRYVDASYNSSTEEWSFTKDLKKGWHILIAKAIDKVGNSKRDFVVFKVV